MVTRSNEKQALIPPLTAIYQEICAIEQRFGLMVGGGDYRPRIEYFHDAVRTLLAGDARAMDKGGRLSVEYLAYDIRFLNHIKATPLAEMRPQPHSPATALVPLGPGGKPHRPDREARQQISELYKNYSVLFAAIFAELADRNYHGRVEEMNEEVSDLARMQQLLQQLAQGKASLAEVQEAARHVEQEEVRLMIAQALHQHSQEQRKKRELEATMAKLKLEMEKLDKDVRDVQNAHFSYLSGQLVAYEDAKEVVKKLASQGLNLAGKFLQSAVSQAQGRGTGRGF